MYSKIIRVSLIFYVSFGFASRGLGNQNMINAPATRDVMTILTDQPHVEVFIVSHMPSIMMQ